MKNFKDAKFTDLQGKTLQAGDTIKVPLTEETVEILLKHNLIKEEDDKPKKLMHAVLLSLGEKLELDYNNLIIFLKAVKFLNKNAYGTILFQEMAEVIYDEEHPNKDLEYVYFVDRYSQVIAQRPNSIGMNLRSALFATEEDAKMAVEAYRILDKQLCDE